MLVPHTLLNRFEVQLVFTCLALKWHRHCLSRNNAVQCRKWRDCIPQSLTSLTSRASCGRTSELAS